MSKSLEIKQQQTHAFNIHCAQHYAVTLQRFLRRNAAQGGRSSDYPRLKPTDCHSIKPFFKLPHKTLPSSETFELIPFNQQLYVER